MSGPPRFFTRAVEAGLELSPDAFGYLAGLSDEVASGLVEKTIQRFASSDTPMLVVDRDYLLRLVETPRVEPPAAKPRLVPAKSYTDPLLVLDDDPVIPASDTEGYFDYFRSRFSRLEAILKRRVDVKDAISIASALKMPSRQKLKTVGIVTEKRTRGSRLFVELEDQESSISVMATDEKVSKAAMEILEDQVVAVDAVKYTEDLLVANEFIWPDLPSSTPRRAREPACAVFLADVHVGSKYFRGDLFERFLQWINMELGPPQSRELASRVRYMVVAGDLVDGIGIYPEQLAELDIADIRGQYREAARLLSRVPDYIEIAVQPGNHDAVRHSMPQPRITQGYAEELYADPRVRMVESPARLSLAGVEVLAEHGKALDDILSSTPGYEFQNPLKAMELLLRCRHLAPRYGQSTPIAPERTDRLVIGHVPDVFAMGHIHIEQWKRYKGCTLLSLGTFQDQTPFQKRVDLTPSPGVVSVLDLQSHQVYPLDFRKDFS